MDTNAKSSTELLIYFGFDQNSARTVAAAAAINKLTFSDISAWIEHIDASTTIRNPCGFLRAVIQSGDLPPQTSRQRRTSRPQADLLYLTICPDCHCSPCLCNWDIDTETLGEYRARLTTGKGGKT